MRSRRAWILTIMICGLALAAVLAQRGCTASRSVVAATPAPQPQRSDTHYGILEFLPDSTLIALEFRNLAARWEEIRALAPIASFQDQLLARIGLEAYEAPRLIGNQAVMAIVAHEDGRNPHPILVLQPDDPAAAESRIRALPISWAGTSDIAILRSGPWLWIAPATERQALAAIVRGQDSGFSRELPMDEIEKRLAGESLVRGWIHPEGVRRWLQARIEGTLPPPVEQLGAILAAELREIRYIAFRRNLDKTRLVTEALAAYDPARLPEAIARSLNPRAEPVPMPPFVPEEFLLIAGFRLEPETLRPWLEKLSASDPRGPFRHLSFWIREFEAATRLSLEHHFSDTLGEYGWFMLFRDPAAEAMEPVWILETRDGRIAENTLLQYRDWLADHVRTRSLGMTWPSVWSRSKPWGVVYGASLGRRAAACFSNTGRHLLLGRSPRGLEAALRLLETRNAWRPTEARENQVSSPHIAVSMAPDRLARVLDGLLPFAEDPSLPAFLWQAVSRLFQGVGQGVMGAWYESDALRLYGHLRLK